MKYGVLSHFCIIFLCFSKKIHFSRFSIDRSYSWTDQICNLKIWFKSAWLDWCWIDRMWFSIDRTYFSTDQKSFRRFFKNINFSRVLHYFKTFQKAFWLSTFNQSNSSDFFSFSLKFSSRILSSCASKTILPFLF